jgi:regulator of extracellular matrix RemA (YlzA/DUF370 family)
MVSAETPAVLRNLVPRASKSPRRTGTVNIDDDDDDASVPDDAWMTDAKRKTGAAAAKPKTAPRAAASKTSKKPAARAVESTQFSRERAEFLEQQKKFFDDVDNEAVAVEQISAKERRRREDAAKKAALAEAASSGRKTRATLSLAAADTPGSALQPKITLAGLDDDDDDGLGVPNSSTKDASDEFQLHRGSAKRTRRTQLQQQFSVFDATQREVEQQELKYVGKRRRNSGASSSGRGSQQQQQQQ